MRFIAIEILKLCAVCMHVFGINAIRQEKFQVQKGICYSHRNSVTVSVRSRIECATKCMSRSDCKSADAEKQGDSWMCRILMEEIENDDEPEIEHRLSHTHIAPVDECMSQPCMNGGTCVSAFNSYSCTCVNGWQGLTCSEHSDQWHQYQGKWYFFSAYPLTWLEAKADCQSKNAELSSVTSAEEAAFLDETGEGSLYWIGLKAGADSCDCMYWSAEECEACRETWQWDDGTPLVYSNWYPGRPRLEGLCGALYYNQFGSAECIISRLFICKS